MEITGFSPLPPKKGGGGGGFPGGKFLGSSKKFLHEEHINPNLITKNVGHNLQIRAILRA